MGNTTELFQIILTPCKSCNVWRGLVKIECYIVIYRQKIPKYLNKKVRTSKLKLQADCVNVKCQVTNLTNLIVCDIL